MKRSSRILMSASLALMLAGMGTCYFGVRHAENQIPPEVLAKMGTHWVGYQWIERGTYIFALGLLVGLLPLVFSLIRRLYPR